MACRDCNGHYNPADDAFTVVRPLPREVPA